MSSSFGERDVPLVAGSLFGLRSFSISAAGHLQPLHRLTSYIYEPGENVARCDNMAHIPATVIPHPACSCGFYAYFRHKLGYGEALIDAPGRVLAAVEGYGKCLVGSEGFRAEKMKIVGLVLDPAPSDLAPNPDAVDTKLPKSARFFAFCVKSGKVFKAMWRRKILLGLAVAQALLTASILGVNGNPLFMVVQLLLAVVFVFAMGLATLGVVGDYGTFVNSYYELDAMASRRESPAIRQAIRDQFPDVPFYETPDDLLNAIPITRAEDVPE